MAFQHGKDTYVSLAAADVSPYTNTSTYSEKADKHDVTAYGKDAHCYAGGLKDGTFTLGGIYDNTAAGPHDVIRPLLGTVVELVRRPEGTGSGLPQETVDVLVESYVETDPVADMISWSCECQLSDDVVEANQA